MPTNYATRIFYRFVFDGCCMLDTVGPVQVFSEARSQLDEPIYKVELISIDGGPIRTDIGTTLDTRSALNIQMADSDTVLVTGGNGIFAFSNRGDVQDWLKTVAQSGARLGATCTGAFLLAKSGLLDGRRAVTHWKRCEELAALSPSINVDAAPIYIQDDDIWTSAGVTAGIDMALAMVEQDVGSDVAMAIARHMLIYMRRPGNQAQFSTVLQAQIADTSGVFDDLHIWVRQNLDGDLSVNALAEHCHMSPRTFSRKYNSETGESPAQMIKRFRLEAARNSLETHKQPLQAVASECGFGSVETMRRVFVNEIGVPPTEYQGRFSV
ncbi:GlxA family transcriptional regulator [Erythrobacter crassostreae]|uniref:DJ-1/PfpI family protein n=1 Tax=Erythrobacter crassostreae TaxID=2828328 RepID=A0A9X1JM43_9SPHN|nr:helix-turn-helix domain-containing protein [Erythrobacter crassostrea]MBV7258999.1 DJ-1/PfpI family protein [Erythrobacter crassostrea]